MPLVSTHAPNDVCLTRPDHAPAGVGDVSGLSRRDFLRCTAVGAAGIALGSRTAARALADAPAAAAGRRPNIIVFLIDDLGYGDIGAFGCPDIPTPHIDSLAQAGVRCTSAYSVCPVCSPSRSSMLTGLYPQRFGVNGNRDRGQAIPAEHPTLPEALRDAGYATGMVGRWDLGSQDQGPLKRGFTEVARVPPRPGLDHYSVAYRTTEGYLTDYQGDCMVEFVQRHKDEPFFLYFCPLTVHSPVEEAAAHHLKRVDPGVTGQRRNLAATVIAMDDAVGKVIVELRRLGLEEETLLFFTSDNGGDIRKSQARNLPFRGGKAGYDGAIYEGAVRAPFIARWPGQLPAGTTFAQPLSNMDIYASALAAAGVKRPDTLDGVDLRPFLTGQTQGAPHPVLYWRWIESSTPGQALRAVRAGRWKWLRSGKYPPQLFDLETDPGERTNLASRKHDIVADLTARYRAWVTDLPSARTGNDRLPSSEPPPTGTGWATVA